MLEKDEDADFHRRGTKNTPIGWKMGEWIRNIILKIGHTESGDLRISILPQWSVGR